MMRSGLISAPRTLERRTDASDSSSSHGWPTAAAMMPSDSEDPREWLARAEVLKAKHNNGNGAGMPLAVAVKLAQWPTARSCSATWATITGDAVAKASERFPNLETVIAQTEAESAIGLALNPAWVESLMGFPVGWTSPLTDGPSAPVRPKGHGKRRASRKTDTNGGNG
jgi:hypothetical protein